MSDKQRQRGRPKGSGINDWERLLTIASLMEKNPKLKVTTAIKELGFTDPSVIRRLRDKFKANQRILLRRRQPSSATKTIAQIGQATGRETPSAALLVAETNKDCRRSATVKEIASRPVNDNDEPISPRSAGSLDMAECVVLGFRSFAIVSGIQAQFLRSVLSHPAADLAVRQHLSVCEAVSSAFFNGARTREL